MIVSNSLGGFALSYIVKTRTSNADVWPGIANLWWTMPKQSKNFTIVLLMFDSFPLDVERMGFSTDKSAVWYVGHNRKSRLSLQLFQSFQV
jgi:hypothetical protein